MRRSFANNARKGNRKRNLVRPPRPSTPSSRLAVTINDIGRRTFLSYNQFPCLLRGFTDQEGDVRKSGLLALAAASVLAIGVMANEKPSEAYVKSMKDTNVAAQSLRKNLEAKDYAAIAKDASTL